MGVRGEVAERKALFLVQLNISMAWTKWLEVICHVLVCYQFKGKIFGEQDA